MSPSTHTGAKKQGYNNLEGKENKIKEGGREAVRVCCLEEDDEEEDEDEDLGCLGAV